MSFSWRLESGGFPASCGQVGATQIEIISTGPSGERVSRFPCVTMGNGTTEPLAPGSYSNLMSLLDSSASSIQTLPSKNATVQEGNDVQMGQVVFAIGASCDPSNCGGCCNGNTCVNVQSDTQCGLGGLPCDNCASFGSFCDPANGVCL